MITIWRSNEGADYTAEGNGFAAWDSELHHLVRAALEWQGYDRDTRLWVGEKRAEGDLHTPVVDDHGDEVFLVEDDAGLPELVALVNNT